MLEDDGWGRDFTDAYLLQCYAEIDEIIQQSPIDEKLVEHHEPSSSHPQIEGDHVVLGRPPESDSDEDEVSHKRFFTPPLQYQRNSFVRRQLSEAARDGNLESIAVMGCGELSLERTLQTEFSKFGVKRIFSVDVDSEPLARGIRLFENTNRRNYRTLNSQARPPVLIQYFHGSILNYDSRFAPVECVVSTEVIEHMPLVEATLFARNVLYNIRPRLFILSTPNHEYNVCFHGAPGSFRHDDHKFEFSRKEFSDWVSSLLVETPNYDFTIHYIGNVKGYEHLGGATQFAIFKRRPNFHKENRPVEFRYKKVGNGVIRYNEATILSAQLRIMLLKFLHDNPVENLELHPLAAIPSARFRQICYEDIIKRLEVPQAISVHLSPDFVMKLIIFLCRRALFTDFDKVAHKHLIIIPERVSSDDLIHYLHNPPNLDQFRP